MWLNEWRKFLEESVKYESFIVSEDQGEEEDELTNKALQLFRSYGLGITSNMRIFEVFHIGDKVIGVSLVDEMLSVGEYLEISIAVDKQFHRRGLGEILIKSAMRWLESDIEDIGAAGFMLHAVNKEAIPPLAKKLGFVQSKENPDIWLKDI